MFFATTAPAAFRRHSFATDVGPLDRFLRETRDAVRQKSCTASEDDKFYTLSFDVPGIAKDQLSIGIEGSVVRIQTRDGAPRQYKSSYELPQEIDTTTSAAKLENGVLTLTLGKLTPASRMTELRIQ